MMMMMILCNLFCSQDVVQAIGEVPTEFETAIPKHRVVVKNCGLNSLDRKYDLPEEDLDITDDL